MKVMKRALSVGLLAFSSMDRRNYMYFLNKSDDYVS
jgi:hypothetical protein